ncbi:MAG: hypothetical protein KIT09_08150 [Bryobacteraceae bacterium]|nr:hypothetical protein [Bryobacteraceae bacterium]
MSSSDAPHPLGELRRLKNSFGHDEARRLPDLIEETAGGPFSSPADLIQFHEILMFLRAWPPSETVADAAEQALRRLPELVSSLPPESGAAEAFDAPEVSGIGGTLFSALFSLGAVLRLARLYPGELDVDWDWYEDPSPIGRILPRFLPLLEDDAYVEADAPYRQWVESAVPPGQGTLGWLVERFSSLQLPLERKVELYDSLRLILKWDLARSRAARSFLRFPAAVPYVHDAPLIQRRDVSLERELAEPPLPVVRLSRREAERYLDLAVTASAVRCRELHGFTFGDSSAVWKADAGRGVDIYLSGALPQFRLPLRACHCGVIVKNAAPVGYFEGLSLFERMELGFNMYYTFRNGETAWVFARLLRLCRQLLGIRCFSIDPYQIGRDNEEAIEAGAFWFYRKIGFRPVQPEQAGLAEKEEKKLRDRADYRTPARTLRKLAESALVFETDAASPGGWDRFGARNVALAVQRRMAARYGGDAVKMRRAATASLARILGASKADASRPGFQNLALVLSLVRGLARWPDQDKRALLRVIRAKDGPDEARYLALMQRHEQLRKVFQELGAGASSTSA